eukprot:COSAG01_NODE_66490_length_270_cov_0.573099_1_plen_43_part_01
MEGAGEAATDLAQAGQRVAPQVGVVAAAQVQRALLERRGGAHQ